MKRSGLADVSNEELIKGFEAAAVIHGKLRSAKEANRAFDEMVAIARRLKELGGEALEHLLALFHSPDPLIRMAAAGLLLPTVPEKAEPVLEQLTQEPRHIGISAKMTLREWRAGRLNPLI